MTQLDLSSFEKYGSNITALRLVDPENPVVSMVLGEWKYELLTDKNRQIPLGTGQTFISVSDRFCLSIYLVD